MTIKQECISYFKTDLTQEEISKILNCSSSVISTHWKEAFSKEERQHRKRQNYKRSKTGVANPMFGKVGELHHNHKGPVSDGKGYALILKPDWYTGRPTSKHIFLHHKVICEALGITKIPNGFCVHHINGDKLDNKISNLALLSVSAHTKLHKLQNLDPLAKRLMETRY